VACSDRPVPVWPDLQRGALDQSGSERPRSTDTDSLSDLFWDVRLRSNGTRTWRERVPHPG
jgi:hypothetical protein